MGRSWLCRRSEGRAGRGRRAGAALALSVAVGVGGVGGMGCASRAPRPLTPEVRAQTFDQYWGELDEHYPFFGISGVDWDAERERWRGRAVAAESPSEFYGTLAAMLSGLGDPHVMLRPGPGGSAGSGKLGVGTAGEHVSSPFVGLAWIGRRAYVRRWPADAEVVGGEGRELPEGEYPELLSIDGVRPHRNMAPLMLRGPERTSVDLEARWPGGERRVVRVNRPPAEFGGGASSGWAAPPAVVHPALMAGTALEQEETLRREIAVTWDDGTETWVEFDGGAPAGTVGRAMAVGLGPGGGVDRRMWGDWLTTVDLGEVGYMRLATLDYEDAEGGISLDDMVGAFDAAVAELMDAPALILDLRYNGGGRPRSLAAVAGKFLPERASLSSPERRFAWLVPYRYSTPVSPRRPVYRGPMAVLINEETGSAAEHLASLLQREGRATVVGERSTGAEALVEIVRGPDGSELRYGWLRFVDEDGDGIQGVGVVPEVEVGLDIERVREIGYAEAVEEVERAQFIAACRVLGVDGERLLQPAPAPEEGPSPGVRAGRR